MFSFSSSLKRNLAWVRAMRLYRANQHKAFLKALNGLESTSSMTPYQLAVKANSLLLLGKHDESRSLFLMLASQDLASGNNSAYVKLYARAMLADISGDTEKFSQIAADAASIPCSYAVRQNLPLR